jgi:hypothetical protein
MPGDDGSNTPKDFNECVSQEQLQFVVDNAQKDMKETVIKVITDAFNELKLGDIIERLDRGVSMLADRVAALETRQPTYEDIGHPEDEVYDAHGNADHVATRQAQLRCRLCNNTTDMGGTSNRNHVLSHSVLGTKPNA